MVVKQDMNRPERGWLLSGGRGAAAAGDFIAGRNLGASSKFEYEWIDII